MTISRGCTLRAYRVSDRAFVAALLSDPDVMRYVGDGVPLGPEDARAALDRIVRMTAEDPAFYIWAVEAENAYAGHAELKRRAGRSEYELIYILARSFWGRGLGGAVADELLARARDLGLTFVIATVHAENRASLALLARRGFERDDRLSEELETNAFRLDLR